MNILIAGTGFSSIMCINYLVNLGLKPTVIDIGNLAEHKNKNILKKTSLIKQNNIDEFHYIGGLSTVWSGVIDKYTDEDFNIWPFNKSEFNSYYDEVVKMLSDFSMSSYTSSSLNSILDYKFIQSNKYNFNEVFKDGKISLKYANILTNKLEEDKDKFNFNNFSPFSLHKNIENLIKDSKILYKKEKIIKVSENKDEVIVEAVNNIKEKKIYKCNYLFLGCGPISNYLIMRNSIKNFDNNLTIKSTKQFILPVKLNYLNNFDSKFFNKFPIFQLDLNENTDFSLYSQIYNLNPNIINFLLPRLTKFNKYLYFIKFFKNLGISYFNLGSSLADEFTIDNKLNIKVFEKKYNVSKILNYYKSLFNKKFTDNQVRHLKFPIKMKPLSGNHFGSVYPMTLNKKNFFHSDMYGRIANFKKISITDSSIFPQLSARPPTFTVLANSLRVVKEVSRLNFFK